MKKVLLGCGIGCGGLIVLAVLVFVLLYLNTVKSVEHLDTQINTEIQPMVGALKAGKTVDRATIQKLAADPKTRSTLYRAFHDIHQDNQFPADYQTPE